MKQFTICALLVLSFLTAFSQDSIRIYGYVTDFNDRPLDSVSVLLKNKKFENLYKTKSNKDGYFSMKVKKGLYYCLYAIKSADYGKTKLEYWAWNVPAYTDLNLNPQYQRMEIYGVNAFEPQVGPWDSYMVYFRPMSLSKGLALQKELGKDFAKLDTIDIAPATIDKEELEISINEKKGEILNVTKILECFNTGYMYGYLVQVKKPENDSEKPENYDKITIILDSKETGDTGKAEYFIERIN